MCEWGKTKPIIVSIPDGLSHTGKTRTEHKEIDECIAPIVEALNLYGIKTASSCCGHGKCDGEIMLQDGRMLVIKNQIK